MRLQNYSKLSKKFSNSVFQNKVIKYSKQKKGVINNHTQD